jgi:hypothetical protein
MIYDSSMRHTLRCHTLVASGTETVPKQTVNSLSLSSSSIRIATEPGPDSRYGQHSDRFWVPLCHISQDTGGPLLQEQGDQGVRLTTGLRLVSSSRIVKYFFNGT